MVAHTCTQEFKARLSYNRVRPYPQTSKQVITKQTKKNEFVTLKETWLLAIFEEKLQLFSVLGSWNIVK